MFAPVSVAWLSPPSSEVTVLVTEESRLVTLERRLPDPPSELTCDVMPPIVLTAVVPRMLLTPCFAVKLPRPAVFDALTEHRVEVGLSIKILTGSAEVVDATTCAFSTSKPQKM